MPYNKYFKLSPLSAGLLCCLLLLSVLSSCRKYLDEKPNKTTVIPSTISDAQGLMDNYITFAISYPVIEQSTDNFFLQQTVFNALSSEDRDVYTWAPQANMQQNGNWPYAYQKVMYANVALETLEKITPKPGEQAAYNRAKGAALFYRGFVHHLVAQIWGQPYNPATAETDLGIPIRTTSDIGAPVSRATVKETYDQILQDLKTAAAILPADLPTSTLNKHRPTKTGAYAALARTYLSMGDYTNAGLYADSSLQLYNALIDYNALNPAASSPIAMYNAEVIWEAQGSVSTPLLGSRARVDSVLYGSYATDDKRKTIFFQQNTGANAGTYLFKGSYDASNSGLMFIGLATDEMYLIRAESFARAGNANAAMSDLNTLLRKRWATGTYTDMTAASGNDALLKILTERRKELLFRNLRWTDLRRLNREPSLAVTLTRNLSGTIYTLPPNDLRYTMLIPAGVLKLESMPQNPR